MLTIVGEFFGSSGYASHARSLANELNKLIDCNIITNCPPGFERDINDTELQMIKREQDFDINLIITHPLHWRVNCSAKRNFVYLIWEGDRVPKWMIDECLNDNIEKIIVPSQHTWSALVQTWEEPHPEIIDKLEIIPHGVDLDTFYPQSEEMKSAKNIPGKPFKFLMNKGFRNMQDRGGIQYGIQSYLEEFNKEDNVQLIVKINPAYGIPDIDIFKTNKDSPKITFITENYTKKELNELYNECDVFISPTRAEAFNIPCLEAMSCGKPVITTNFGGQTDFCSDSTGIIIGGELINITHEIEYEGVKWLTPDHEKLKKALRHAFNNKLELKRRGEIAKTKSKQYTWENTVKQIHSLI